MSRESFSSVAYVTGQCPILEDCTDTENHLGEIYRVTPQSAEVFRTHRLEVATYSYEAVPERSTTVSEVFICARAIQHPDFQDVINELKQAEAVRSELISAIQK